MQNKELLAGTEAQQRTAAESGTSASLMQNGLLSAALSVEEGNILIAGFLGYKKKLYVEGYAGSFLYKGKQRFAQPGMLKYHSSWDWLMPVWKKLGNLMYEIRRQVSEEDYKRAEIITIHVLKAFQKAEIDSAFNWIVEGIKWYNDNTAAVGSR